MTADGAHDFDFLHGDWDITHERLRERLAGCSDWDTSEGSGTCRPVLHGLGNFEHIEVPALGVTGMTLRLYDPETGLWSLHWATTASPRLDPPLRGRFVDGVGTFHGEDVHGGRPVSVRFVWDETSADGARWRQAFSLDGEEWEENWVMTFRRQPSGGPA